MKRHDEGSPGVELVSLDGRPPIRPQRGRWCIVGRAENAQHRIDDPSISRRHAELKISDRGLLLRDVGSTNGTFLNETKITQATVSDGDTVRFGQIKFRARATSPAAAELSALRMEDDLPDGEADIRQSTIVRQLTVAPPSIEQQLVGNDLPRTSQLYIRGRTPEERRQMSLALLLEISKDLSKQLSLDTLLEKIVDITCQVMSVHRVAVLLKDDETEELIPRVWRQRGAKQSDEQRLPRSILRKVVEERIAVLTDDAVADQRFDGGSVILQNVCGAMCTPLLSRGGEVLGVIYVDNLTSVGSYGAEELDFLASYSGIAGAAIENSRMAQQLQEKAVVLSNFERYFAPDLAAKIASEKAAASLGGEKRLLTVMFTDIRGFTTMAERLSPEVVVSLLNEYFTEMVDIVFEYGGTLDKFIGDAIMANWGAPLGRPDDPDRALAAAIEMQRELERMNERKNAKGMRIEVGIGINYGEVFVGNIGSHRRLEYTVIGDPVNTASRLCAEAGPGDIIVSGAFLGALAQTPEVQELPAVNLKGKARKVEIYRVCW